MLTLYDVRERRIMTQTKPPGADTPGGGWKGDTQPAGANNT